MTEQTIAPISASKLVKPEQVPALLLERRERLAKKLEETGFCARFGLAVPDHKKEMVLRTIFEKHWDLLTPSFNPSVKMIGGLVGEPASGSTLRELAVLKHKVWGKKDGNLWGVEDYLRMLREQSGPTPIFAYYRPSGEIEGAVFPMQVHTARITTWNSTTGDSTWKADSILGDVGICPMICSYRTVGGVAKVLIVEGALPYFSVLSYFNYIYDLLAYSRPEEFGPAIAKGRSKDGKTILDHLPADPNYAKFHERNNSRLVCIVDGGVEAKFDAASGGYGFIAGYKTHLCPNGELLPVLQEIGKDVARLLLAA